jgi:hypothetical protein
MLQKLFVLCFVIVSCFSCATKNESNKATQNNYEAAKKSIATIEAENPIKFLSATAKDRKNIVGQTVIKCAIASTATVATYKDIAIELSFFSKTNTLLEKDIETIYETVAPNSTINFKTKYFAPKGTSDVMVKIISAKSN